MKKRWKIPVILAAIIITLGVAVKFAVDRLFSYILYVSLSGTQINIDELDSLLPDGDTTKVLPEIRDEEKENLKNPGDKKGNISEALPNVNSDTATVNENVNNKDKSSDKPSSKGPDNNTEITAGKTANNLVAQNESTGNNAKNKEDTENNSSKKNETEIEETINKHDKNYDNHNSNSKIGNSNENTSFENNVNSNNDNVAANDSFNDNFENNNANEDNSETIKDDGDAEKNTGTKDTKEKSDDKDKNDDDEITITPEKMKKVEKNVSPSDKNKVLGIVFSRLSSSDIKQLLEIAVSKSTVDEKISKAKQVLRDKITEEDKETLKFLYNKYEHLVDELKE
ncbi:MAG TPA: hypothetical protein GXX37_10200 [Clostridiaceae bacterium]|nr:hypothetical protein [Clostridiaceae bacterium]